MTGLGALVLVVEDEPQMRSFIRASLSSHGYRVSRQSAHPKR